VLASKILDLCGLLVDHSASVLEVGIDELFVGDVDERGKVKNRSSDEREAPKWNNLDQPIGSKGREESL
jgi:hypothetical protein